ncbi:MAG: 1-acyl-sn-glycerol-3-phosphate acyltransferase [Oscillospiraceae bacterium]|nr:1-acyl-sn-glycerol-3-phosphate acyltransferase [Oscillospiraceae bacterium]
MNAFVRGAVRLVYRMFYNIHFEGIENIPENEGVIIASNHRSYADPVLLTMYMKKPVRYMAKEELFKNKLFGAFIKMLGAFPVRRGKGDMQIIEDSVDIIKQGHNLVIFPEGTRAKENKVGKGKTGVAMIAAKAGADVLPVGICFDGPKLKFRCKLTVKIGKLIKAEELSVTGTTPKELKGVKRRIMDEITTLVEGQPHESRTEKLSEVDLSGNQNS